MDLAYTPRQKAFRQEVRSWLAVVRAYHQCSELMARRLGVPELPPVAAPGSYAEDVGAVVAAVD